MNFKEIQTFNKLPHTPCPAISMHTISILSSEKKYSPSRASTLQYIGRLKKKKRFLDPTSNMLNQNRVEKGW